MVRGLSLALLLGIAVALGNAAPVAAAFPLDYEFDIRACRRDIHVTGTLQRTETLNAAGAPTDIVDRGPITGVSSRGDKYTGRMRMVWRGLQDDAERLVFKTRIYLTSPTARDVLIVEREVSVDGQVVEYSKTKECGP